MCCGDFEPTIAMLQKFNSKVMYCSKKDKGHTNRADHDHQMEEMEVDDPSADSVLEDEHPLAINLETLDDNTVPIPEWDEMLDLLASVENDVI